MCILFQAGGDLIHHLISETMCNHSTSAGGGGLVSSIYASHANKNEHGFEPNLYLRGKENSLSTFVAQATPKYKAVPKHKHHIKIKIYIFMLLMRRCFSAGAKIVARWYENPICKKKTGLAEKIQKLHAIKAKLVIITYA